MNLFNEKTYPARAEVHKILETCNKIGIAFKIETNAIPTVRVYVAHWSNKNGYKFITKVIDSELWVSVKGGE